MDTNNAFKHLGQKLKGESNFRHKICYWNDQIRDQKEIKKINKNKKKIGWVHTQSQVWTHMTI